MINHPRDAPKTMSPPGANGYLKMVHGSIWCKVLQTVTAISFSSMQQRQILTWSATKKKWSKSKRWVDSGRVVVLDG